MHVNSTVSARENWISARAANEALEEGLLRGMCYLEQGSFQSQDRVALEMDKLRQSE